jgi:hypothetical protein
MKTEIYKDSRRTITVDGSEIKIVAPGKVLTAHISKSLHTAEVDTRTADALKKMDQNPSDWFRLTNGISDFAVLPNICKAAIDQAISGYEPDARTKRKAITNKMRDALDQMHYHRNREDGGTGMRFSDVKKYEAEYNTLLAELREFDANHPDLVAELEEEKANKRAEAMKHQWD